MRRNDPTIYQQTRIERREDLGDPQKTVAIVERLVSNLLVAIERADDVLDPRSLTLSVERAPYESDQELAQVRASLRATWKGAR